MEGIKEKNQIVKSSFDNLDNLFKNAVELKELSGFFNANMGVIQENMEKGDIFINLSSYLIWIV